MEQMPKPHREEFENLVNRAHEEALRDNARVDVLEMELREAKGVPQEEGITYESISPERVSTLKLPEMEGRSFSEVIEYVKEKFGDKYIIPGEGYLNYLINHPNKTPAALKGITSPMSQYIRAAYFVGSVRGNMDGQMSVAGGIPPSSDEDKKRLHEEKNPGQVYNENLYLHDNKWQSWDEDHLSLDTKFSPNYEIVLIEKNSEFPKAAEEKVELQKPVDSVGNMQTGNEASMVSVGTNNTEEAEQLVKVRGRMDDKEVRGQLSLEETIVLLEEKGYLDTSFEDKKVHSLTMRPLSKEEAIEEYKKSGSKTLVWDELEKNMPYITPKIEMLDVMVMKFNKLIGSDETIAQMDKLGVRPLTYEELIQYGIVHPAHQKQKTLIGLGSKHILAGNLYTPCLRFDDVNRNLDAELLSGLYHDRYRFLVVRK